MQLLDPLFILWGTFEGTWIRPCSCGIISRLAGPLTFKSRFLQATQYKTRIQTISYASQHLTVTMNDVLYPITTLSGCEKETSTWSANTVTAKRHRRSYSARVGHYGIQGDELTDKGRKPLVATSEATSNIHIRRNILQQLGTQRNWWIIVCHVQFVHVGSVTCATCLWPLFGRRLVGL